MSRDYIIFSSIDWKIHWQLHQQLSKSLNDNSNRVLFVENTGVRRLKFMDYKRVFLKFKDRFNTVSGVENVFNRLSVLTPLLFPFPYTKLFIIINSYFLTKKINKWIDKTSFNNPIIITFLPTPVIHRFLDLNKNKFSMLIYYCANHMSEGTKESLPLKEWENKMFSRADMIFSISENITKRSLIYNEEVHFFPPGVDVYKNQNINKEILIEFSNIKQPSIGYIGSIGNVFDIDLILYLAKKFDSYCFALIGPVYVNVDKLKDVSNIVFFGPKDHKHIFSYIDKFNIGIIPYIKNTFTDNVYCCKLNEYLLSGIPVISSDINEVLVFNKNNDNIIYVAKSKEEFSNQITNSLNNFNDSMKKKSINIALKNNWKDRYNDIDKVINNKLKDLGHEETFINYNFINHYKSIRKKFIILSSSALLLFLLIFNSPLFWFLGENLIVRQKPSLSEAIVIFSGDGESTYINQSYQKRALDAINYINKGYSDKLILSSGKGQTINEVVLLQSYLLAKNIVVANQIHIFNEYPSSTYANVLMVGEYLIKNDIKKIGFITSPYHSFRANLIWKKNFPLIDINVLSVIDTPKNEIKWSFKISEIKIILYEYLAILYNFYHGRL